MKWIVGIDEVGRGPLAGPITVAAVAIKIKKDYNDFSEAAGTAGASILSGIKDSKQLSEIQRGKWNDVLSKHRIMRAVSSVGPRTIDRIGIANAARQAVARCLCALERKIQEKNFADHSLVLLDGGLYAPQSFRAQKTFIKGDERVPIIAAASIVAKIHRDRNMVRLHRRYPKYGFNVHKGYGTALHRARIVVYGLSAEHRSTFCSKMVS